jgi:N-acetyl-alpha-D-glucosaminyl L-malate synthase BshA
MDGKLKVGIVCYPTIGGSGIVATELGFLLAAAGHEVHFISYERPVRLDTERPNLHFHPVIVNEYALFKYPDYTLPLSVRISEVIDEFGLDVLHVHYAVPHATAALLAQLMLGNPRKPVLVTTLHGTDTSLMGNDAHYQPIIKFSIENSCGVTTVSEYLRQQTIDVFDIKHPIQVIPNFYKPGQPKRTRQDVRDELGVSEDDILLLHMSNVRPVKRIGDILEALALLKNRHKTRLLILAGGNFTVWEPTLDRLGLREQVTVLENVHTIGDYADACDVGVYASEQESFGLGILETLAHGKPVVATQIGGIPEVVKHDQSGLLVPVSQPALLAEAVDRLIDNPEFRNTLGNNAKADAKARFNPEKIRDQYLYYYRKLMNNV